MAGYRAPGDRFINATTKNDQMDDQRSAYRARPQNAGSERGIARSTTPLFRMPTDILELSTSVFSSVDIIGQIRGNPDFGVQMTNNQGGTPDMFDDVDNQSDMPNRKGPNLIAPDIDDATFTNDDQQTSQFTNRGFGWRDQRNEPATEAARIGEYFSKHYSVQGPPEPDDKVIFGEAKSPDSDTNIDYDQP